MLKEILKVVPSMDEKDLRKMQKALQTRFTKVAKSFGKGMVKMFKAGGPIAIALGLIAKLLNPLQEVQEALDRALQTSADIATNAKQFGTTEGNLAKLTAIGRAKGIEDSQLYELISKFQGAVAKSQADPEADSYVKNFVGFEDMAEGFFQFIQSIQKLDKNQQIMIQRDIFGEKQVLKMASFLQEQDFAGMIKRMGIKDGSSYTGAIQKTDQLANLNDELNAARWLRDINDKGRIVNEDMIRGRARSEELNRQRENQRLSQFQNLQNISDSMGKIMQTLEQGLGLLGGFVPTITQKIDELLGLMDKLMKSNIVKGIIKFVKGG